MLPDDQETRLRCYRNALQSEATRLSKFPRADFVYVTFRKQVQQWLRSELEGYSLGEIIRLLHEYLMAGGQIQEVQETRPEFVHDEFHYDLRVAISGRRVYFETILVCEDPADAESFTIHVVSVHDV